MAKAHRRPQRRQAGEVRLVEADVLLRRVPQVREVERHAEVLQGQDGLVGNAMDGTGDQPVGQVCSAHCSLPAVPCQFRGSNQPVWVAFHQLP